MAPPKKVSDSAVAPMDYEVRHLTMAEIQRAFPLVREITGALGMAEWRRYASQSLASGNNRRRGERGVVGALKHGSIYLRGLCAYRLFPELTARDRLIAGCFAVPETIDCIAVAQALIAACGSIAEKLDCGAVQFHLVDRNQWIAALLHEAGYVADQHVYAREIRHLT